jgi:uncharacterized protein YciI
VTYYLVLLREVQAMSDWPDHEPFIDSLMERNAVLLGGPFDLPPLPGVSAAYVLRCTTLDEARALVAVDPLVTSGAAQAIITRWDLVGIDLGAIDEDLT